jgi:hypothetical protein
MDVFQRLDEAIVHERPFPHVILRNALDPALCASLLRERPALDAVASASSPESNRRYALRSEKLLASQRIGDSWKAVARAALDQTFLNRITRLFATQLMREYPDFSQTYAPIDDLQAKLGKRRDLRTGDVGMQVQIAVNAPVNSHVQPDLRGPHLDNPVKLFVGLLYLRPEDDLSVGGDLELYAPVPRKLSFGAQRSLRSDAVRTVGHVPYEANTLVLFLNTPRSLHGVSPRGVASHPRYVLNFYGTVARPLFRVNHTLGARIARRWSRLRSRAESLPRRIAGRRSTKVQ